MRRLAPVLLSACLLAVFAAGAQAAPAVHQETASAGSVSATLDYTLATPYEASDVRLTVTRGGATVLSGGHVGAACRECGNAIPVGGLEGSSATSVRLADLTGDGDPEVLVDLYTGGTHCCSISVIYGWDAATSAYRPLARNWGDPGYALARLGGGGPGQELVSADDRFAYRFCAFACSAMPIQVWRYRDFRLVDVTRRFPARVRRDLRALEGSLRQARRHRDQRFAIPGLLPALCADQYLLGRGSACRRVLHDAVRRGDVPGDPTLTVPGGRRYARAVLRFLHRTGYR